MLNPSALIVLKTGTVVLEDGFGEQQANCVAATGWHGPSEKYSETGNQEPHYKVEGSHGAVYVPESAVKEIITIDPPEPGDTLAQTTTPSD